MDKKIIRKKLNSYPTEKLKTILKNEQENYSPEALETIKNILNERQEDIQEIKIYHKKLNKIDAEKKYHTLRFIASFIYVLAWIFLIIGLLIAVGMYEGDILRFIIIIFAVTIILVPYFALSEIIRLFIDMEENTRITNEFLKKIINTKT